MCIRDSVYTGLAGATLGIKSAADALGLDFIPITEEPVSYTHLDVYKRQAKS